MWCQGMRLLRVLPSAAKTCNAALTPWHRRGDAWILDLDFHWKCSVLAELCLRGILWMGGEEEEEKESIAERPTASHL